MNIFKLLVAVGGVACLSCSSSAGPATTVAAADEVRQQSRALAAAESAHDVAAVMPFWSPDAVIHVSGAEPIKGSAAVRATFEQLLPAIESLRVEITSLEVARSGEMAYETGTNYLTLRSANGSTPS